jgi:hypothetical protein
MKRTLERLSPFGPVTAILCVSLLLSLGCGAFVSPFDETSYEHLTSLKAFHLKFIDDFTAQEGKQWDNERFEERQDEGELKFREALNYESHKKKRDRNRETAIEILYEQFKADCDLLKTRADTGDYFFGEAYAAELKEELQENYGQAIRGEVIRRGGPENP